MPKNWYLPTVVLEKTPESPLERKESKPVNLKRNQPWIFIGRTDVEAEAPVFWSSDDNRRLTGKVPNGGKIEGRRRRGCQRIRWLEGITSANNLGKLWEMVRDRESCRAAVHGVAKNWIWLGNSTATNISIYSPSSLENRANNDILGLKSDLKWTVWLCDTLYKCQLNGQSTDFKFLWNFPLW